MTAPALPRAIGASPTRVEARAKVTGEARYAYEYEADAVTHDPAYRYDTERFGKARFIWSKNLVVDNTVLCRSS